MTPSDQAKEVEETLATYMSGVYGVDISPGSLSSFEIIVAEAISKAQDSVRRRIWNSSADDCLDTFLCCIHRLSSVDKE